MKRLFDIFFSLLGLTVLAPVFIVVSLLIKSTGKGDVFYKQLRIGYGRKPFHVFKFRTMKPASDITLNLTIGNSDARITATGRYLRRFKIDELPQLYNVLKGEMSFVGPRPEVPKYVAMYTEEQLQVLTVKPGITDYASIRFRNENELLAKATNPEQFYINEVMPVKLALNMDYVKRQSVFLDVKLIVLTVFFIFVKS